MFELSDFYAVQDSNAVDIAVNQTDLARVLASGMNLTVVNGDNNQPVACGGLLPFTDDVFLCWLKISDAYRKSIRVMRLIKDGLKILYNSLKETDSNITVVADASVKYQRFMEFLGFKDIGKVDDYYIRYIYGK